MERLLEREWLDDLPASDPRAVRSRRDLQRLNGLMGHAAIIESLWRRGFGNEFPVKVLELGAGDGTLLLRVLQRMPRPPGDAEIMFVDQRDLVTSDTRDAFARLGWKVTTTAADVFDWLDRCEPADCMVANLFLHHFTGDQLTKLFVYASRKTRVFLACEPRRSRFCLGACRFLPLIGCNRVTRHDGKISVRAGFRGCELTGLWPNDGAWQCSENLAGLFSHCFLAKRMPI